MQSKDDLGLAGEEIACQYLRRNGYRILEQRFRTKFGELDIVCRKGRELVFVEVRSRKQESGYLPEESITRQKIRHLVKAAQIWLTKKKLEGMEIRFDLVTIDFSKTPTALNHFPAAFDSGGEF